MRSGVGFVWLMPGSLSGKCWGRIRILWGASVLLVLELEEPLLQLVGKLIVICAGVLICTCPSRLFILKAMVGCLLVVVH